jgi:hypothetical protein
MICGIEGDYRYANFSKVEKGLLGMSCLILWASILQFVYFFHSLYALTMTIQTAVPR